MTNLSNAESTMNPNLQPYPAYKPSGLEWLPDIPAHWGVARISRVARDSKDSFTDGDWVELPYITDNGVRLIQTGNVGIGKYREQGFRYIDPLSFEELNCTEVFPGDILICRLADPVGRACLAPNLGVRMITSVDVCILKPSEQFSAEYIVFLLSSKGYLDYVKSIARGSTRSRISRSMLGAIKIPRPPLAEQHAIVRYLDHADRRIQRYIQAKEKLITLLHEVRQSTIHRAVTRGLNPDVPLKPSGVDWLGDIPAHWRTERGKWLFKKMKRPVRDADEVITCFRDGVVTLRKNRRTEGFTESLLEIGYQGIRAGDFVIHAMDAFAGAIGVADSDGKGTPVYSVCSTEPRANPYYFAHAIREMARSQWIAALATGIRERSTDFRYATLAVQKLPLPPLPEQRAIVAHLDKATAAIDTAIDSARRQAELMHEYRASLIAHVVTGKLDVRAPAAQIGMESAQA